MEFATPKKKQEINDKLCIKAINKHFDLAINYRGISRNPRTAVEKPWLIRLVKYNYRREIFDSKKKLKGQNIANTDGLTVTNMKG